MDFADLDNCLFDLFDIFAIRQKASGKTHFTMHTPRPTDGLLLFAGSNGVYYQEGHAPLYVPQGALVYLPRGSSYVCENAPMQGGDMQENLLFEFTLHPSDPVFGEKGELQHVPYARQPVSLGDRLTVLTMRHTALYRRLFCDLIDAFSGTPKPLTIYERALTLLRTLSANLRMEQENPRDLSIIKEGIRLLIAEETPQKSIAEIAAVCNISVGYFERLFHSYAGVSPLEYRTLHRINHIKMLLQKNTCTLDEIAATLGYCDSGYLCRIFKRKTGMTPKAYRKAYLADIADAYKAPQALVSFDEMWYTGV